MASMTDASKSTNEVDESCASCEMNASSQSLCSNNGAMIGSGAMYSTSEARSVESESVIVVILTMMS